MTSDGYFSDIIGHAEAKEFLRRAISWQALGQPLLFAGPGSVGKMAMAERLSRALLSVTDLSTHPDFVIVRRDADEKTGVLRKDISIEQIRVLRSRLQHGSFLNAWKVAIVDDAELLSPAAGNALLKTLEEPAPRTMIILVASSVEALPATIRSRCQIIRFRLVSESEIAGGLLSRGVSRQDAERSAACAGGRPGAAIALAEDSAVRPAYENTIAQGVALIAGKLHERLRAAGAALSEKLPQNEQAAALSKSFSVWTEMLREALAVSLGLRPRIVSAPALTSWAAATDARHIAAGLLAATEAKNLLRKNINPRLCLEHFVLSFV